MRHNSVLLRDTAGQPCSQRLLTRSLPVQEILFLYYVYLSDERVVALTWYRNFSFFF